MSIELVHIAVDCGDAARLASFDAETARLVELGAALLHEKREHGAHWRTLADPEGNEFCVVAASTDDEPDGADRA